MFPTVEPKVQNDIDRRSLRSIYVISLIVIGFEMLAFIVFLSTRITRFDHNAFVSLISVCYCITLCAFTAFFSKKMLREKDLPHRRFFLFKILFFVAFTVWAIFVDYRHFKMGDQLMTFYTVNLLMACFIIFRPWIGAILVGGSFIGLYIPLYLYNGAAGIEPLNLILFAFASIASNAIRCQVQISVSSKTIRLKENNEALETASRRDGLTGLQNRLALEADAEKADGRKMTAYMIDINYFKEINDQYGHAAGDAILRRVSETLKHLFPDAHYYRYGGDEFLVLTYKPAEDNYGSDSFDFEEEKYGVRVILSIGNAQGSPANYQELFDLISSADKALYVTKQRTHSVEYGGHERRKRVG
jgi:diguanylate cyclase (GGDEF)-like protein